MKTYIIGHQKPDTDAVVSTLAFAHIFKQEKYWGHQQITPCITHPLNPETKYIFKKAGQKAPKLIKASQIEPQAKIVLVDHNETFQQLSNLNQDQITEIFDHHKINLNLNKPIFINTKPWGSTCTIAWHIINQYQYSLPKKLAFLILCAILSDTVGLRSSTTTPVDQKAVKALNKIAQIKDLKKLTLEIFKAKSNIIKLPDEKIVTNDFKIYHFSKKTFIGQLETVEQAKVLKIRKKKLLNAMDQLKKNQKLDLLFLAVSDILKINTKLLLTNKQEEQIALKAFGGQVKNQILDIGSKLSRKKEIAPAIEKALS